MESVNYPGHYLRHQGFMLKLHKRDGSDLFNKDASFKPVAGLVGKGVSFESSNYPGRFIRHQGFMLKLHEQENADLYKNDVSFNVTAPQYAASTNTLTADQFLKPIGEIFQQQRYFNF